LALSTLPLSACESSGGRTSRGDGFNLLFADLKGADLLAQDMAGSLDMGVADGMPDMAGGGADLSPAALSGKLVAGGAFPVGGATAADEVVAEAINPGGTLGASPAGGGGNPQTIAMSAPAYAVRGSSVFVWDGVDMNTHVGGLLLWSSMRSSQRISGD